MAIPRQRIRLPQGAWRSAIAALLKGDLWTGQDTRRFEKAVADYIAVRDAVAVPSGRAGFRFLFDSLDIEPGGEVICSAFGYPVVPFIVKSMGYKLRFVDCELHTLGMDPELLREACSTSTQAVIATHLYGVPCQIREIAEICAATNTKLIEDCAHCYGATSDGQKIGSFGDAGCFSFETSKVINTMGGGMVTLRDTEVASRLRKLADEEPRNGFKWLMRRLWKTSFEATVTNKLVFNLGVYQMLRLASSASKDDDRFASGYQGDEVSLKGKMGRYTNYQARLGLRQLKTIEARNQRRTDNAERLIQQLDGQIPMQTPMKSDSDNYSNYMLVSLITARLSELASSFLRKGVDSKHLYMRDCSRMFEGEKAFPNAARAEREVLHIPAYPEMTNSEVDRVAASVSEAITELNG